MLQDPVGRTVVGDVERVVIVVPAAVVGGLSGAAAAVDVDWFVVDGFDDEVTSDPSSPAADGAADELVVAGSSGLVAVDSSVSEEVVSADPPVPAPTTSAGWQVGWRLVPRQCFFEWRPLPIWFREFSPS